MAFTYFFRRNQRCRYVKWLLEDVMPSHVQGEDPPYVINLEWNAGANKGVSVSHLDANRFAYVRRLEDLPPGKGLLVLAYDGVPEKIAEAKARGVKVLEKPCPWVVKLRNEILSVRSTHRCVIMIEEGHVVHQNYRSIFPPDTIFINRTNYEERLASLDRERPIHFLVYATFRTKDAEEVVAWMKSRGHDHSESIYSFAGICSIVTASGNMFEQLREAVPRERLDEVWIITSGVANTSVESMCAEIVELGARARLIHTEEDVPSALGEGDRVGVITAPTPYEKEDALLDIIRRRFGAGAQAQ